MNTETAIVGTWMLAVLNHAMITAQNLWNRTIRNGAVIRLTGWLYYDWADRLLTVAETYCRFKRHNYGTAVQPACAGGRTGSRTGVRAANLTDVIVACLSSPSSSSSPLPGTVEVWGSKAAHDSMMDSPLDSLTAAGDVCLFGWSRHHKHIAFFNKKRSWCSCGTSCYINSELSLWVNSNTCLQAS